MTERVQKLLSQAGIASRRAAEDLIRQGRVTVNGNVAQLGDKADLSQDTVRVDGEALKAPGFVYYLLNKPRGVVSTNKRQPQDSRRIVRDLIPHEGHLFTVGRLDTESEGLIILTNDGELADKLMHPRYGHTKTYHALVAGVPTTETLDAWRRGIVLDDKKAAPVKVRVLQSREDDTLLELVMREGRKRQIRRVGAMLGHPVKKLTRVKIEFLEIGHLEPGQWRELSPAEVRQLKQDKPRKK
ncbi:MAG: rRNA pseudouridine synthase [Anaerolineae bacterium]|nr:rRNA pseudouridine synthase [Anaerolineae bacterium]